MSKKTIKESFVRDHNFLNSSPKKTDEFSEYFQKEINLIPDEYKESAMIEIDSYQDSGYIFSVVDIYCMREETDEEEFEREEREDKEQRTKEAFIESNERIQLDYLKNKYEGKGKS